MDKILRHDSLAILSRGPIYLTRSSNFLLSLWTKSYDVTTFMIERLQQYFHVVLFIQYVVGVTIQMELLQQYFHVVLFIQYAVGVTIQMELLQQYFRLVLFY